MKRRHWFEWEDQPWLPVALRDYITDHLHHAITRGQLFAPVLPLLRETLTATGQSRIVDLCSGGGGPFPELAQELQAELPQPIEVVLTDLYPNAAAVERVARNGGGQVSYRPEPTNAFDVPVELTGVRTIFTALHHFRPEQVRLLLADAVAKRQPICAFESLQRDLHTMIKIGLFAFLSGLLVTQRVGRVTLPRALWTYSGIAPLLYAWDGVVSCMRMHTPDDLRALTTGLGGGDYAWEIGQIESTNPFGPYTVTYLVGRPASAGVPHE